MHGPRAGHRATLAQAIQFRGRGLHTGVAVSVEVRPAAPSHGIRFRRCDLQGTPEICARPEAVCSTERRTVLGTGGATIETTEHFLAAVAALGLDDLLVMVDGPELPAIDGCARTFFDRMEAAGRRPLAGRRREYALSRPLRLESHGATYDVRPGGAFRLRVSIDWAHPAIGHQSGSYAVDAITFSRELADARTFGFLTDAPDLARKGLGQGPLDGVVVLGDRDVLSGPLHWPDEFVRHKALDLLGDLAILGGPVAGEIRANRPGHGGNAALAQAIHRACTAG